jgi:hypothetical protein
LEQSSLAYSMYPILSSTLQTKFSLETFAAPQKI